MAPLTEWLLWYKEHRNDGRSIEQEVEFIKKSLDGVWEQLAELQAQTPDSSSGDRPLLYVPTGRVRL